MATGTVLPGVARFNMDKAPMRPHLAWLIYALSAPDRIRHRNVIRRIDMDGVKPPYLLLCNHNAFMDFKVASHAIWPARANYVVAIDGFIGREWLLRLIGCICTRKFTSDLALVRSLKKVIDRGGVAAIYPEARYSLCGTTAVLPESLGKLAKLLKVPVVTLMCHGHHVNSPFYHLPDHGVKGTEAELSCILRPEELSAMTPREITDKIRENFVYDDFAWQRAKGIRITYPRRAEGLHKVLYQCCECGAEYRMGSQGTELYCTACGRRWTLTELGELEAESGKTRFAHVPDWYEWERANVRAEVTEGRYHFEDTVRVRALPNARRFRDLGLARLTHDERGFVLEGPLKDGSAAAGSADPATVPAVAGDPADDGAYRVEIPVPDMYSCHIEYEYLGKFGDCIDLNTRTDTLYLYPQSDAFAVTKIALATEELYDQAVRMRDHGRKRKD